MGYPLTLGVTMEPEGTHWLWGYPLTHCTYVSIKGLYLLLVAGVPTDQYHFGVHVRAQLLRQQLRHRFLSIINTFTSDVALQKRKLFRFLFLYGMISDTDPEYSDFIQIDRISTQTIKVLQVVQNVTFYIILTSNMENYITTLFMLLKLIWLDFGFLYQCKITTQTSGAIFPSLIMFMMSSHFCSGVPWTRSLSRSPIATCTTSGYIMAMALQYSERLLPGPPAGSVQTV